MSFPSSIRIGESVYVPAPAANRPKLAFVRFNFDWTADSYWVKNPDGSILHKGVSRPTKNDIDVGRSASIVRTGGLPDTLRMIDTPYTTNLEARGWKTFIKTIWHMEAPELTPAQLETAYNGVYATDRAYNNKAEDAQDAITSAGSVVSVFDVVTKAGVPCYQIKTLRGDGPPPDPAVVNPWTMPWFFFCATNSRRETHLGGIRWQNEHISERFWQLGTHDVWLPLLCPSGENFLPVNRLRPLADSEPIPSPYT